MGKLKIKLIKSTIRKKPKHKKTVKALGLRHVGAVVEKNDCPEIRGMINTVSFMLDVEEIK